MGLSLLFLTKPNTTYVECTDGTRPDIVLIDCYWIYNMSIRWNYEDYSLYFSWKTRSCTVYRL